MHKNCDVERVLRVEHDNDCNYKDYRLGLPEVSQGETNTEVKPIDTEALIFTCQAE